MPRLKPPLHAVGLYKRDQERDLEKENTCELSEVGKDSTNVARMEVSDQGTSALAFGYLVEPARRASLD